MPLYDSQWLPELDLKICMLNIRRIHDQRQHASLLLIFWKKEIRNMGNIAKVSI